VQVPLHLIEECRVKVHCNTTSCLLGQHSEQTDCLTLQRSGLHCTRMNFPRTLIPPSTLRGMRCSYNFRMGGVIDQGGFCPPESLTTENSSDMIIETRCPRLSFFGRVLYISF
jgi:hypothetical protein